MSKYTNGLRQDGTKWTARTTNLAGGRVQRTFSAGTSHENKAAAREWLLEQQRIRAGLGRTSHHQPTNLGELVEVYLSGVAGDVKADTLDSYQRLLSHFLSFFGHRHSFFLSQLEVNEYVRHRKENEVGRGICKELDALRRALHYCGADRIRWNNPGSLRRIPKRECSVPTASEYRRILLNTPPEVHIALYLALYGGLRDAEVYRIGWDSYTQSESILRIPAEIRKNKVGNVLPVVNTLREGISKLEEMGSTPAAGSIVPVNQSVVAAELRKVTNGKWRGLQPARRLLVTTAEALGYGSEQISLITGHARSSMVSRYSHGAEQLELKRRILEDVEKRLAC